MSAEQPSLPGGLDITLYEALLFVHITSIALWTGGALVFTLVADSAARSEDPARLKGAALDMKRLSIGLFQPASLVALITGIWLVLEGNWGFEEFWVLWGIGAIVVTGVLGAVVIGREGRQLGTEVQEGTVGPTILARRLLRIVSLARVNLVILVVTIFMMAIKPGT